MTSQWIGYSLVVGSLLLAAPGTLEAREPKPPDPCKELKTDLDNQVNSLHRRQDDELAACRQANGKNADVCRDLKKQQQLSLSQMRDEREAQLAGCNPRVSHTAITHTHTVNSCDRENYNHHEDYNCSPREKYPGTHPPKYPPKDPPPYKEPPYD